MPRGRGSRLNKKDMDKQFEAFLNEVCVDIFIQALAYQIQSFAAVQAAGQSALTPIKAISICFKSEQFTFFMPMSTQV